MNREAAVPIDDVVEELAPRRRFRPYPEYRDSRLPWYEQIPSAWCTQKLKYNSYIKGRIGWQNLRADEFTDCGPYLVTGMHFENGGVDWNACYHITEDRYALAPEIQLQEDDVLVTKDGSIGKIAFIDSLPGPASLNSHLLVIRPLGGSYSARYLYHLLSSEAFRSFIRHEQRGTTFFGNRSQLPGHSGPLSWRAVLLVFWRGFFR